MIVYIFITHAYISGPRIEMKNRVFVVKKLTQKKSMSLCQYHACSELIAHVHW